MEFIAILIVITIIAVFFSRERKVKYKPEPFDWNSISLPDFATYDNETGLINCEIGFEESDHKNGVFLVVDVETTGLPKNRKAKPNELSNWPRILQIAWMLFDLDGKKINAESCYLKLRSPIPKRATEIHGIDRKLINEKGENPIIVWEKFLKDVENCSYIISHNTDFDIPIIQSELIRNGIKTNFKKKKIICTMKVGTKYCEIPRYNGRGYKYPKLEELFKECFFEKAPYFTLPGMHDAFVDTSVTAKCFFKLLEEEYIDL